MSEHYDVVVLGLGGMGSSAAAHLARRGQRVLGIERHWPAHDRGSSHGESRIIRQAYFEDPAYVPLLLRAYELWRDLEAATGMELLTETGGLMIGPRGSRTLEGSVASAGAWDLPHEVFDADAVHARWPTFRLPPDDLALFEARAGLVRPEATVAAHHNLARRHGATLRFDEPVAGWETAADGVVVRTATGSYSAGRLVIAAGAWAGTVLAPLGLPLSVERHVQFWFRPPGGVAPYAADRHPIWVWEGSGSSQVYGFPALGGDDDGVKVAFFRHGTPAVPDQLDRSVGPGEAEPLRRDVARLLPDLAGEVIRAVPCMYTSTPDEHFVIGRHPEFPQVVLAAGFSGHGFKFVPVVGEILADLAIDGRTHQPIALFDPTRFSSVPAPGA